VAGKRELGGAKPSTLDELLQRARGELPTADARGASTARRSGLVKFGGLTPNLGDLFAKVTMLELLHLRAWRWRG
jgi:hypothetical protein